MAKVYVQIALETEERTDRWACRSPEFGFTVYGKNRESARQEVNKALAALINSFHGDLDAVDRFLNKRGVRYYYIQRDHHSPQPSPDRPGPAVSHCVDTRERSASTEVALEEVVVE